MPSTLNARSGSSATRSIHELTALIVRRLRASVAIGTPVVLPSLVLVGPPDVGKSWYLARLADALALPFRIYPSNLSSLTDGLAGSQTSWRGSAPGLIAKTLLSETIANPLVLIDEIDKAPPSVHAGDPYRPLYTLLEPTSSWSFVDKHVQFPIDASTVSWVRAANDVSSLPTPILDRLTVIVVPEMRCTERAVVVQSIYVEANARFRMHFDPTPSSAVVARLAAMIPRRARLAVKDAMVRAAAAERRTVLPEDVPIRTGTAPRGQVH